jgi:hypothetical protein
VEIERAEIERVRIGLHREQNLLLGIGNAEL